MLITKGINNMEYTIAYGFNDGTVKYGKITGGTPQEISKKSNEIMHELGAATAFGQESSLDNDKTSAGAILGWIKPQ
jgi:hypothetical protein